MGRFSTKRVDVIISYKTKLDLAERTHKITNVRIVIVGSVGHVADFSSIDFAILYALDKGWNIISVNRRNS